MKTNGKEIRVLMIGPGEGITGGISTLVDTVLPVLEKQVSFHYFVSVRKRLLKDSGKLSVKNLVIAFSQYTRFLLAILQYRPNIVHLHTSQGIAWLKDTYFVIVSKAFGINVVLHLHGGNFDTQHNAYPRIIQRYTCMILGMADAIITVSNEWKTRLAKLVPAARIFPLKNCIDYQSIVPRSANRQDHKDVNVLFIGRIGPLKGAFDLIEAIRQLQGDKSDLHVWLVGPEEREGDFQFAQRLIERYQLTATFELFGSIPRRSVLELLREASLFVLPSYYEGLPMVVLEALMAGLPVIATPVGGIPEVVRDTYNGLLIPCGDVAALAEALETLLVDDELRECMGTRSREIAERELDVDAYVNELLSLYSSLVAGGDFARTQRSY